MTRDARQSDVRRETRAKDVRLPTNLCLGGGKIKRKIKKKLKKLLTGFLLGAY